MSGFSLKYASMNVREAFMMKKILQLVLTGIVVYSIVNICVYFLGLHNAAAEYTQLQMNVSPSRAEDELTDDYVYAPLCSDISMPFMQTFGIVNCIYRHQVRNSLVATQAECLMAAGTYQTSTLLVTGT